MAQHLFAAETSDMEETFVGKEMATSPVPGSRLGKTAGKTAVVGAAMIAIGVMVTAAKGIWSSQSVRARPDALIVKQSTPVEGCFEKNVAYKLGKVKQGKSEWTLADEKRDSAHECQLMCLTHAACEFFTFKPRTKRCIVTSARGEKLKNGHRAVSGPRFCAGDAQPCKQYLVSSKWTLPGPDGGIRPWQQFTSQLNGQNVKFLIHGGPPGPAWEFTESRSFGIKGYPLYPENVPPNHALAYHPMRPSKNLTITVEGDPIENMVLMFFFSCPAGAERKYTLSDGTWIPIFKVMGWYENDVVDDGRTISFGCTGGLIMGMFRLSKPVSEISITSSSKDPDPVPGVPLPGQNEVVQMLFQGKQC